MLAYGVLAAAIIVSLHSTSLAPIAFIAVPGLGVVFMLAIWQGRKLEAESLQNDARFFEGLLSSRTDGHDDPEPVSAVRAGIAPVLSDRETQVLREIASGSSNKEIASALGISENTVKNHLSRIFEKLEVGDRTSAVLHAMEKGWIDNT
jgi:DNA-binding NarL/FixJ family response regulator